MGRLQPKDVRVYMRQNPFRAGAASPPPAAARTAADELIQGMGAISLSSRPTAAGAPSAATASAPAVPPAASPPAASSQVAGKAQQQPAASAAAAAGVASQVGAGVPADKALGLPTAPAPLAAAGDEEDDVPAGMSLHLQCIDSGRFKMTGSFVDSSRQLKSVMVRGTAL